MKVLLAQCQNKMGNFSKSYELYKEIIQSRGNEIENETDCYRITLRLMRYQRRMTLSF